MIRPPFKLASRAGAFRRAECCDPVEAAVAAVAAPARLRLGDMDPHLHCSVVGTCLGTAELRKLMAPFIEVRGASDLQVHHEAVRMAGQNGAVTKALHKALDQRHDATLRRFARAADADALTALWNEALHAGEVPGAYWAVLTQRRATPELRQQAFGDVHMLSHLVGAANRADIRRLVALERDNAELRERLERQQQRTQDGFDARDTVIAELRRGLANAAQARLTTAVPPQPGPLDDFRAAAGLVAVQTGRRERAEQLAAASAGEAERLREELAHLGAHAQALGRELAAAETQLREAGDAAPAAGASLGPLLHGKRILYVGGRPSSTPAIRDLVLRHGGEFQRHDGGLEDRKGLLAAGIAWAERVLFPVDCIGHDSAATVKRLCQRHGVPFVALRSASVASFVAALANPMPGTESAPPFCVKHG